MFFLIEESTSSNRDFTNPRTTKVYQVAGAYTDEDTARASAASRAGVYNRNYYVAKAVSVTKPTTLTENL